MDDFKVSDERLLDLKCRWAIEDWSVELVQGYEERLAAAEARAEKAEAVVERCEKGIGVLVDIDIDATVYEGIADEALDGKAIELRDAWRAAREAAGKE